MKKFNIFPNKVQWVIIGFIITIPFLCHFIYYTIYNNIHFLSKLSFIIAIAIAIFFAMFINPMISYKRNKNICVSGVPFPVYYGMPIEDGCFPGHVVPRNLWFNTIYISLLFATITLLSYTIAIEYGVVPAIFYGVFIISITVQFLNKVLKFYPIDIEPE